MIVIKKEAKMRYKVRNTAALKIALGDLQDQMRVEVEPGLGVSAKTVGELRKLTVWPENLAITVPLAGGTILVSKPSVATRFSAKT